MATLPKTMYKSATMETEDACPSSPSVDWSWEKRAEKVLEEYRDKERRNPRPRNVGRRILFRSNELVEIAYQTASQLVVGLLTPEINPIVKYCFRRPGMVVPSFSDLFTVGFVSKLFIDVGLWCNWRILRWIPRLRRGQAFPPWHRFHLEISCLSTILGLGLGKVSNEIGIGIQEMTHNFYDALRPNAHRSTNLVERLFRLLVRDSVGRAMRRLPTLVTVVFAPFIASLLMELSVEAQSHRCALVTQAAIQRLYRKWKPSKGRLEWVEKPDVEIPPDMLCPITRAIFVDPVVIFGIVFERYAAETWVAAHERHPLMSIPASTTDIYPAPKMRELVRLFAQKNGMKTELVGGKN